MRWEVLAATAQSLSLARCQVAFVLEECLAVEGRQGLFLHGVLVVAHHVLREPLADVHWSHECEVKAVLAHQRLELLARELLLALDRLAPAPLAESVEVLLVVWYLGEE